MALRGRCFRVRGPLGLNYSLTQIVLYFSYFISFLLINLVIALRGQCFSSQGAVGPELLTQSNCALFLLFYFFFVDYFMSIHAFIQSSSRTKAHELVLSVDLYPT